MSGGDQAWTGAGLCHGLADHVTGAQADGDRVVLSYVGGLSREVAFTNPACGRWLEGLGGEGRRLADWQALVADSASRDEAEALIGRLAAAHLLVWWWGAPGRRLVTLIPLGNGLSPLHPPQMREAMLALQPRCRLSDRAVMFRQGADMLVLDPLLPADLLIAPAALPLLPALIACGRPDAPPLPAELHEFLILGGVLRDPVFEGPDATAWSPLAVAFHQQTRNARRLMRHRALSAGTAPPIPPLDRRGTGAGAVALADWPGDRPSRPLREVVADRVSRRTPGPAPLRLDELGAVLGLVGRRWPDSTSFRGAEIARRNIPGGGSLCETDFYVAAGRVGGLERGFYRYDGQAHALVPAGSAGVAEAMIEAGSEAIVSRGAPPDCLIVVSARLSRLAHKYGPLSYRLAVLHGGVAVEALYLAAADLGLSGCAIGAMPGELFETAVGTHPMTETAIVEFALSGPSGDG